MDPHGPFMSFVKNRWASVAKRGGGVYADKLVKFTLFAPHCLFAMTTIDPAIQLGFIGAGQMATALALGFVKAELLGGNQIHAFDPHATALQAFAEKITGANVCESAQEVVEQANVVILAVKPQMMAQAIEPFKKAIGNQLFVSIAAGIPLSSLCKALGTNRVIRVMPNTPALVREGAAGFSPAEGATSADCLLVGTLLSAVGIACRVEEKLLDAVTGLSGSGPAFVYMMIEALADGGVKAGLPRDIALRLAAQTVRGAATMVSETGEHPAVLKDRVASPAGTTIAGIAELEEHGMRGAVIAAVTTAADRARQLGG